MAGRTTPGIVVSTSPLLVNVSGAEVSALWPAGYIPSVGDRVRVLVAEGVAEVLGPVVDELRPVTGTISGSAASGRVSVSTSAGTKSCRYTGTAPANGTLVRIDWQSTEPWIWPQAAAAVPTSTDPYEGAVSAPSPPPEPASSGSDVFVTVDAGRWRVALSRWDLDDVRQGSVGSLGESNGAWFFGDAPGRLAGRTVDVFQMYLPPRLDHVGDYNVSVDVGFYRHTSNRRPSGDVTRTSGPTTVSIPSGWAGGWMDLPASYGQSIVDSGGGLGIVGTDDVGFEITGQARFRIEWRR